MKKHKIKIILILIMVLSFQSIYSSSNNTFTLIFGGNAFDTLSNILVIEDGYIISGILRSDEVNGLKSNGKEDIFLTKIDKTGKIIWQKLIGGNGSEHFGQIIQLEDGTFIIGGYSTSTNIERNYKQDDDPDTFLAKIDKQENIIWQKLIGGTGLEYSPLILTENNGNILIASTYNKNSLVGQQDIRIYKLDNQGHIKWNKTISSEYSDSVYNFIKTHDNNYLLISVSNNTLTFTKIDKQGNILWQKPENEAEKLTDADIETQIIFSSVLNNFSILLDDGGFIIIRKAYFRKSNYSFKIQKIDKDGNEEWVKVYGEDGDRLCNVLSLRDAGFLITSKNYSIENKMNPYSICDIKLIKIDAIGNIEWEKDYAGSLQDGSFPIINCSEGGFLMVNDIGMERDNSNDNEISRDFSIKKLDENGNIEWNKIYSFGNPDIPCVCYETKDKGYIIGGHSKINKSKSHDLFVLKLDNNGNL